MLPINFSFLNGALFMSSIGDRIRSARKAMKYSQPTLAGLVGVSKATISFWENDLNSPNGENLVTLARVLKTSPSYILGTDVTPVEAPVSAPEAAGDRSIVDEALEIVAGLSEEDAHILLPMLKRFSVKNKPEKKQ